jgi:hypothetical protein
MIAALRGGVAVRWRGMLPTADAERLRVTDFVAAAGSLALCCATGRGLVMGGCRRYSRGAGRGVASGI